ncbi:AsnC family protein [Botrimarina hoheduenensis]|uniref:Uncharacterized protein n=1 Tax=Botrimarina hoheduenensis TaxID=2528000 RepID=A0A5C5VQY8_9BACT|nr:AsnC family protein [Botrimarina hoheduenensis]TWT40221.1 hypothetical protein Pla111_33520 [Botrimarina hoheduenensis]
MARHAFREGSTSPARLLNVWDKPIENRNVHLLRIEFEIFNEEPNRLLVATGRIACRDVVVGDGYDLSQDRGVCPYVMAFNNFDSSRVSNWLDLANKRPWVEITFGKIHEGDQRNAFKKIGSFDASAFTIKEYAFKLDKDWQKIGDVAGKLGLSENTVRRRIKKLEPEHGALLVRYTPGGHRVICWPRLHNLLSD